MDNFNRDELVPPAWMDLHFMEKVLKNSENSENLKIIDFTINPATGKGDHFASIMFRANVTYLKSGKNNEISMIIKTMPVETGKKKEMLEKCFAFETEIGMYSEVIPKFHQILRQHGDKTILGARMLYCSLDPHKVIVFEDITKQGYTMFTDRFATFDEIKVILEKICRWHAISFKLINEGDNSLNKFDQGVFSPSNAFSEILKTEVEHFADLLSTLPGGQIYYQKFREIKGTLLEKIYNIYQNTGDFCVLNHGDFHLKNMMPKFGDAEKLQEVMLVDFQFCILAPIAIDLIYLLYMNIDFETRSRRDEIIYIYYNKFVDALKNVGYEGKVPSLTDLHMEIMKCKHLELYIVGSMLPFVCVMMSGEEVDPEAIMESSDARAAFYKHPAYLKELNKLLPMLLHKGYFED